MLTNILRHKNTIKLGTPVDTKNIILCQKNLASYHFPTIPNSFIQILHKFNSVSSDGAHIFGIYPHNNNFNDILTHNLNHNKINHTLLLGFDEFDYLGYNELSKNYQIIDKDDGEVLEEYPEQELELAISYILKIINE